MKETLACLPLVGIILVLLFFGFSFGVAITNDDVSIDGRTREQLVERGLAEYVIVDNSGTTEWRWKE